MKPEPSMEQILASIRKIMAEEEAGQSSSSLTMPGQGGENSAENILELTQVVEEEGTKDNVVPALETAAALQVAPDQAGPDEVAPDEVSPNQEPNQVTPDQAAFDQVLPDRVTPELSQLSTPQASPEPSPPSFTEPAEQGASHPSIELEDQAFKKTAPGSKPEQAEPTFSKGTFMQESLTSLTTNERRKEKNDDELASNTSPISATEMQPPPESLLTEKVQNAGIHAIQELLQLSEKKKEPEKMNDPLKGRTIDEIMEGLLRPLLSNWLNQNLPLVVEKVVKEEIRKLVDRV